jgi:hypothetical protein
MSRQNALFEMVKDSDLRRLILSPQMWLQVQLMRVMLFVLTFQSLFWKVDLFPFRQMDRSYEK